MTESPVEFYHLDRAGTVDEETTFELEFTNKIIAGESVNPVRDKIYADIGVEEYDEIEELFDGALSRRGRLNLYEEYELVSRVLGYPEEHLDSKLLAKMVLIFDYDDVKELVFELVRRTEYNSCLSRYQAFFGSRTVPELLDWYDTIADDWGGDLYTVETQSHSVHDASLLDRHEDRMDTEEFVNTLIQNAREYWAGNETGNPVYEVLLKPPVENFQFVETIEEQTN